MDFNDWQPTYREILAEFGWDESDDAMSARALQMLVPKGTWRHVGTELKHRARAVVVGCAASLETLEAKDIPPGVVVAADGATQRLREIGVVPRVVVTDLDGDMESLLWAAAQGSSIVVHAHGHNRDVLSEVTSLGPLVAGSCQCDPTGLEPLRNLGGFTDGDRAVLLCESFQVREIALVCFETESRPSRYSHNYDAETKPRKLAWARRIVEAAKARGAPIRGL